jgi:hypothetical protein
VAWPAVLFAAALATAAGNDSVPSPPTRSTLGVSQARSWYASHSFVALGGCLAVPGGRQLVQGDCILVFVAGQPARTGRVSYRVDGDSARRVFDERGFKGVYSDPALWDSIGCYWGLRDADRLRSLARYEPVESTDEDLPLAIEGLPPSARVLGGDGVPLDREELDGLLGRIANSVPPKFSRSRILRVGRRYGSREGGDLVEVFLGNPAYRSHGAGAPIDSVEICHLFLREGRVLAMERFSRSSGREEQLDAEPPQLDSGNWFQDPVETVGYVSLDRGATWDRLTVNPGTEGIHWAIWRLEQGIPLVWDSYVYIRN